MSEVIITCAITGGIHAPTMSDALPFKPSDIAAQSIAAAKVIPGKDRPVIEGPRSSCILDAPGPPPSAVDAR
jgi:hypothetical protein